MTLVLSVNGPDTIWMLTDRRISYANRPPRDDARKMLMLTGTDGVAMVGYAGLGETAGGTEPADWMNAVLRGRQGTIEQCLGALASALAREFPRHLLALSPKFGAGHLIVAPAFIGNEARLYSIRLNTADRKGFTTTYERLQAQNGRLPRLAVAGSGAAFLLRDRSWMRQLLRLARACDERRIEPPSVAQFMANLNNRVSLGTADNSVGPRSFVAWRHGDQTSRGGGGGHCVFAGAQAENDTGELPTIANGMDVSALVRATLPFILESMPIPWLGKPAVELNQAGMNSALAKLPDQPDERLV